MEQPATPQPALIEFTRAAQAYDTLGDQVFRDLVDAFYRRVAQEPLLRPMFPDDLEESKRVQYLFLIQFFGGPQTYSQERGHPRLRMRHFPFAIGLPERNAWLGCMLEAVDEVGIPEPWAEIMRAYFERASIAMMNR
jgi:hemoglobin